MCVHASTCVRVYMCVVETVESLAQKASVYRLIYLAAELEWNIATPVSFNQNWTSSLICKSIHVGPTQGFSYLQYSMAIALSRSPVPDLEEPSTGHPNVQFCLHRISINQLIKSTLKSDLFPKAYQP